MEVQDSGDGDGPIPPSEDRPPMDPNDPKLIEKLVEELKSQGILDDIRKECLAEVDTKVKTLINALICLNFKN